MWMFNLSWIVWSALGAIYPLILVAVLSRRDVKAAVTDDGYQQTFSPE
jgi:hypothetical protein